MTSFVNDPAYIFLTLAGDVFTQKFPFITFDVDALFKMARTISPQKATHFSINARYFFDSFYSRVGWLRCYAPQQFTSSFETFTPYFDYTSVIFLLNISV